MKSKSLHMYAFLLGLVILTILVSGFMQYRSLKSSQFAQAASTVYYVAPNGSDSAAGTVNAPWKTINKSLTALSPGDTLVVRGGTYTERIQSPLIKAGTTSQPITVKAYSGEKPVVKGLFWLSNASYWRIDGINVMWGNGASNEHMVKMLGGTGWTFTNAEVSGAHSYAGVLVSGGATSWTFSYNYVHDTFKSNSTNQDHLVYVNEATNGIIERNIFSTSPNGRGVKLGPPSGGTVGPSSIIIRYNTFYNNLGPSNIQVSYGSKNNLIYRNILQKSSEGNITGYNLNGSGNKASDNIGWESQGVISGGGIQDGGGNLFLDPQLKLPSDFHPANPKATAYGRYAGDTIPPLSLTKVPVPQPSNTPLPTQPQLISPTLYCLGAPCPVSTTPTQGVTQAPPSAVTPTAAVTQPCGNTQNVAADHKEKKHRPANSGGVKSILSQLIEFIMQLLQLLFGSGNLPTPTPSPTDTPVQPTDVPTQVPGDTTTPQPCL